jgi:hypothetical protein
MPGNMQFIGQLPARGEPVSREQPAAGNGVLELVEELLGERLWCR